MDLYNQGFLVLIDTFNEENVKYLIVGGWAVNHFGYSRTTGDVDFWLKDSLENRTNLVKAFNSLGYGDFKELLTLPLIPGYCEIYLDIGMYADLLSEIHGYTQESFDEAFNNREVAEINNTFINYINFKNLIHSKAQSDRKKDQLDVIELKKISKL